eukprot:9163498-Lingulodinium_polyedra.AAC.1
MAFIVGRAGLSFGRVCFSFGRIGLSFGRVGLSFGRQRPRLRTETVEHRGPALSCVPGSRWHS